ncbi:MAG: ABC transporter permease [Candidatus Woesearchaeota archaeon]
MLKDYFNLSVNGLKQRKLRSWLTMLGIFVGIATIVALISLGQGLENVIISQFSFLSADMITVTASTNTQTGVFSDLTNPLGKDEIEAVKDVDGIESFAPRNMRPVSYVLDDVTYQAMMTSLPIEEYGKSIYDIISISMVEGEKLDKGEKYSLTVGYNVAKSSAYERPLEPGDTITIEEKEFEIKGIIEKKGSFMLDNMIGMPEVTMNDLFDIEEDEYAMINIKARKGNDINEIITELERKLMKARDVDETTKDFNVESAQDTLEMMESTMFGVQLFIYIIAGISLVVGGIGIMNTMYTSVLERTKDIGIMKAIGARNSVIFTLFFIESGLLGSIGGLIGIALGSGLALLAQSIGSAVGSDLIQAHISLGLLLGALLFSFIIGAISGISPAMQAAKMHPVNALRKTK